MMASYVEGVRMEVDRATATRSLKEAILCPTSYMVLASAGLPDFPAERARGVLVDGAREEREERELREEVQVHPELQNPLVVGRGYIYIHIYIYIYICI